jgi:hypothetical protein
MQSVYLRAPTTSSTRRLSGSSRHLKITSTENTGELKFPFVKSELSSGDVVRNSLQALYLSLDTAILLILSSSQKGSFLHLVCQINESMDNENH